MLRKKNKKTRNNKAQIDSILSQDSERSIPYEQIKNIRSSIQFASTKEVKSLMVTSSESGAGKSFISTNLALSFAEQELNVLLVDTDLRRPTIHKLLGKRNSHGITNVLIGSETIEECVQETEFHNLSILTSGFLPPNPAELLGSDEMKLLVEELTNAYDIVIFDTPPVLPVVDATLLSNFVDGVIFVVRSGYTDQHAAIKAVEKLRFAGSKIIGAVLNGKSLKEIGYYSEYY